MKLKFFIITLSLLALASTTAFFIYKGFYSMAAKKRLREIDVIKQ